MTTATSPSWYDVLDVAPDASEDRIRAAWKSAIADLDPTDRRFRVRNQAAEVLLDPRRRAAYDAELAAQQAEAEQAETARPDGAAGERDTIGSAAVPTGPTDRQAGDRQRRVVPAWLLAGVAVLTAVAVGVAAWLWFAVPSDASVEESTRTAESAAERAVGPILSYDYQHLDEDQQAAESYMTAGYRKDYDQLFAVIKQNAPGTQTVVKADVVASGIVRSGDDRVDVLLFVEPADDQQAAEDARRLQGPGHGHHGEGRRRLAGRRHGDLARGRLSARWPVGSRARPARALDRGARGVHHRRQRLTRVSTAGCRRYCGVPVVEVSLRFAPALKCESPARWLI